MVKTAIALTVNQNKQSTRQVDKATVEVLSTTEFTNLLARYKQAVYETCYQSYCSHEIQKLLTLN